MMLIDTSIWIDHFDEVDERLDELLARRRVVVHPFVVGELAVGNLRQRERTLADLLDLPQIDVAHPSEVLALIDAEQLWGSGVGYVDAHLLASLRIDGVARLWTRDRRLQAVAERLGVG